LADKRPRVVATAIIDEHYLDWEGVLRNKIFKSAPKLREYFLFIVAGDYYRKAARRPVSRGAN
jgi:hypothetical protein